MDELKESAEGKTGFLRKQLDRERKTRFEAEAISEQALRALYIKQGEMELLLAIADAANRAANVEEVIHAALRQICAYTRWPIGHAYFLDGESRDELVSAKIWHLEDPAAF